ncbi:hypothetical protein FM036_46950 [Nostoc sp. HG1]|nr:hypothetical protein [Nostoc sp. HG1]
MIKSLLYFLWAGLFEIGGGYLSLSATRCA